MSRGQSTLDYVILVGVVAAGLVATLVFVGRGHQGNLRSQAEQLDARQYEPGNTRINNWDTKNVTKTESAASSTTTKHSANPQGQKNIPLEGDPNADPVTEPEKAGGLLGKIAGQIGFIYQIMDQWEQEVVGEGTWVAGQVRGGWWPWSPAGGTIITIQTQLATEGDVLDQLKIDRDKLISEWPEREPDESVSGSGSSEHGSIKTTKHTDEILGDL